MPVDEFDRRKSSDLPPDLKVNLLIDRRIESRQPGKYDIVHETIDKYGTVTKSHIDINSFDTIAIKISNFLMRTQKYYEWGVYKLVQEHDAPIAETVEYKIALILRNVKSQIEFGLFVLTDLTSTVFANQLTPLLELKKHLLTNILVARSVYEEMNNHCQKPISIECHVVQSDGNVRRVKLATSTPLNAASIQETIMTHMKEAKPSDVWRKYEVFFEGEKPVLESSPAHELYYNYLDKEPKEKEEEKVAERQPLKAVTKVNPTANTTLGRQKLARANRIQSLRTRNTIC